MTDNTATATTTATTGNQQSNNNAGQQLHQQISSHHTSARRQPINATPTSRNNSGAVPTIGGSSAAFQQIKQTQSSLARLTRVHQLLQQQQQQHGQINQSSQQQQQQSKEASASQPSAIKATSTFVDCLIRRFKDCFSEDFCTVPMFVVGNLSPGSDGTHLILPPCVSLGRQNISRFANPRNNLRHMNSIRESCKSIEELDLGGNKLSDLIEVYKILQCTPNLRFLNLSENDLSKTSPVAMASGSCPSTNAGYMQATFSSSSYQHHSISSSPSSAQWQPNQQHRTCLAPINQNNTMRTTGGLTMPTRRHSTLGQAGGSANPTARQTALSRSNEARRLNAATAALAQSKKTSSSVASKLAHVGTSVAAASSTSRQMSSHRAIAGANQSRLRSAGPSKAEQLGLNGRSRSGAATSTMNLARSLSSLSAKDVGLLTSRRMSTRRVAVQASRNPSSSACSNSSRNNDQDSEGPSAIVTSQSSGQLMIGPESKSQASQTISPSQGEVEQAEQETQLPTSKSGLFSSIDTPIAETDADVDMNDQPNALRQSISSSGGGSSNSNNNNNNNHNDSSQGSSCQQQQQPPVSSRSGALLPHQNQMINYQRPGSHQSITSSTGSSSNFRRTFRSIKALALNNTGCPWRVVCSILSRMPNLEELHLSLNNYERIDLDPNEFKHHSLKRLYLCNNPKLTSWQELDKLLSAFPSLEALSIADCNISQIPDNLDRAREWQKLCGLNINGWPIKEWPVVDRLNQLPSLIDLKCRNLEVLQSIEEPRHHLIARLPKLQRLNGSEIEEREHAEKAFLRFFMANSHLERPSRFHELVQIHGEVTTTVDVDVDLSPPSQASVRVIHLNRNYYRKENQDEVLMSEDFLIKLMDNVEPYSNNGQNSLDNNMDDCDSEQTSSAPARGGSSGTGSQPVRLFKDEGQEVVAFDVDLRQSVRKFKITLGNLFGLDHQNIILYYIDHEMVGLMGPELIKHNQKKLWNYNVQNGDQFIVEER